MLKFMVGLGAALALGACATHERVDGQDVARADGMVCINDQVTGSRQPRRICHTQEQWAQIRKDGQESVRLIQRYPEGADPDPN